MTLQNIQRIKNLRDTDQNNLKDKVKISRKRLKIRKQLRS